MFIEKEPKKAVENQKVKKAVDKEPSEIKKPKKDLKAKPYQEQLKATSPRAKKQEIVKAADQKKDPATELRKMFRDMDMPEKLAPSNVDHFHYDAKTGSLTISLKGAITRQFDKDNTITFEDSISGTIHKGAFTGIDGIRKGHGQITSIVRLHMDVVAMRAELGHDSKTLQFRDKKIPAL